MSQASVDYLYDFAEQSRYGVPVKCRRQNRGAERVVIIGVPHDTSHVSEECSATGMDWSFRNEFWVDSTGFVWKTRQIIESDTWELRHPSGPDVVPFLNWRAAMTDEQWVDWSALEDEAWYERVQNDFGMNVRAD